MKKLILLLTVLLFSTALFSQVTMYYQYFDEINSQYYTENSIVTNNTMAGDENAVWSSTTAQDKYYVDENNEEMVLYASDNYDWNSTITFDLTDFGSFSDSVIYFRIKFKVYGGIVPITTTTFYNGKSCALKNFDTISSVSGMSQDIYHMHKDVVDPQIGVAQDFVATLKFEIPDTAVVYVDYIKIYVYNKVANPDPHARLQLPDELQVSYKNGILFINSPTELKNQDIRMYNMSGQLVHEMVGVDLYEGRNPIPLPMNYGVYVVWVGTETREKISVH
jgi:hypothetical protein